MSEPSLRSPGCSVCEWTGRHVGSIFPGPCPHCSKPTTTPRPASDLDCPRCGNPQTTFLGAGVYRVGKVTITCSRCGHRYSDGGTFIGPGGGDV